MHPKTSLQMEMGMLPLRWEVKRRCIEFWHRVMNFGKRKAGERGSNGCFVTERGSEVVEGSGTMPCRCGMGGCET